VTTLEHGAAASCSVEPSIRLRTSPAIESIPLSRRSSSSSSHLAAGQPCARPEWHDGTLGRPCGDSSPHLPGVRTLISTSRLWHSDCIFGNRTLHEEGGKDAENVVRSCGGQVVLGPTRPEVSTPVSACSARASAQQSTVARAPSERCNRR